MLPKTRAYVKNYDGQTKWMHFLIKDDDFLEIYDTIWDKVGADIYIYIYINVYIYIYI